MGFNLYLISHLQELKNETDNIFGFHLEAHFLSCLAQNSQDNSPITPKGIAGNSFTRPLPFK